MNFRDASDLLTKCLTHEDIAEEVGGSVQSIRAARLDPSNPSYRTPPSNWREAIAKLARGRGGGLIALAEELEADR